MTERNIKSRIINKHDIEAHWLLAENFIPKQGEIIVYDSEVDENGNTLTLPTGRSAPYTYERIKVGDGKTLVSDLPFIPHSLSSFGIFISDTEPANMAVGDLWLDTSIVTMPSAEEIVF